MTLTDEELDALAERLEAALERILDFYLADDHMVGHHLREAAREAARWAEEQQGEVVWEVREHVQGWMPATKREATVYEETGFPVRAIRVIATTTKGNENG